MPEVAILVTAAIGLYLSISHDFDLKALEEAFNKRDSHGDIQEDIHVGSCQNGKICTWK